MIRPRLFSVLILCFLNFSFAFPQSKKDNGWINLLDQNMSQWENYLCYRHKASYNGSIPVDGHGDTIQPVGYNKNTNGVFSIIRENNDLLLKVTGEFYGCVITKQSYKNYRLRLKVKWGTKKWEARTGKLMDAGILYHSQGPCGVDYWRAWMLSQEFQIMEGHFGDYWNIANSAIDIRAFLPEGTMNAAAGNQQPFLPVGTGTGRAGFCMRTADYSTPENGWTELELICFNGKSFHIVNGHVVMVLANSRFNENGVDKPLIEGKIQLQSEGCEVYYKDIKIKMIDELPNEFQAYFN
jgi:3-keto-disaccharide hydrolase